MEKYLKGGKSSPVSIVLADTKEILKIHPSLYPQEDKLVWGGTKSEKTYKEFWEATSSVSQTHHQSKDCYSTQQISSSSRWTPPPPDVTKINCDAAWNSKTKHGGIGIILRDESGFPISAYSCGIQCDSALIGEAYAIRSGLLHAATLGFTRMMVESDCQKLINQLCAGSQLETEIYNICHDIFCLQKTFVSCSFSFVPRSSNTVADSLARAALSVESPILWPSTSQWLLQLCNADATACNDSSHQ
ncbi:uncharacterized protein LOC122659213 [Telopea speciosissima]|uniref:uncharacterized protein LOC122659213 n=1 Tax=Telopea speciosissima TaxID=54955 RepID=UPI001CC3D254|nr:uncharacterized protein LOC122659213 [Telopea speciosissima]